ncbi:unnamed protein product, partial [Schistosoma curassoni]|uniref:Serine/threonine protein kinase n=1 Tax=Schistosoma curassoni TaxID=6186 RepID=A0A183K1W2_9TREM
LGTVKELVPYSASIQQNPRAKLLKRYVISRTNQPMNNTGTDEIKASSNTSSLPKSAEYTSTTTNTISQPDTTGLPNIPVSDLLTSDNLNASANSRQRKYHHRTRKDITE